MTIVKHKRSAVMRLTKQQTRNHTINCETVSCATRLTLHIGLCVSRVCIYDEQQQLLLSIVLFFLNNTKRICSAISLVLTINKNYARGLNAHLYYATLLRNNYTCMQLDVSEILFLKFWSHSRIILCLGLVAQHK